MLIKKIKCFYCNKIIKGRKIRLPITIFESEYFHKKCIKDYELKKGGFMDTEVKKLSINGVVYVPKGSEVEQAKSLDGMRYVIVRTYSAGVYAGYLESRIKEEVVMIKARLLWYWDGAASLSQLAMEGTSKPENCKFPCEIDRVELTNAIAIIDCKEKARKSIQGVKIWQA